MRTLIFTEVLVMVAKVWKKKHLGMHGQINGLKNAVHTHTMECYNLKEKTKTVVNMLSEMKQRQIINDFMHM